MVLTLSHIVIVALIGVSAWFGSKWLFKKDTEVENRRRAAAHLANKLTEMGFKELPVFFLNYAVGDYSGMAYKLSEVARTMMGGEKAVLAEMDDVFTKLLAIKLNTSDGRFAVKSKLEEVEKLLAGPVPVAPVAPVAPIVPVTPDVVSVTPNTIAALVNLVPPSIEIVPEVPEAPEAPATTEDPEPEVL